MKPIKIPFSQVETLSNFDKGFQDNAEKLSDFLSFKPELEEFGKMIKKRELQKTDRSLLSSVLKKQYKNAGLHKFLPIIAQLELPNTFTITTAHQPLFLTGPTYFIFKLISAIKLSAILSQKYPQYNFLTILYLGGEDHDTEELNHTYLWNQKIEWNASQTGSVGRMLNNNLDDIFKTIYSKIKNDPFADDLMEKLKKCYKNGETVNESITKFIHSLMANFDFLVLNADEIELKQAFSNIIKEDIFHQKSEKIVLESQKKLQNLGIKAQAMPRPINFFI